MQHRRRSLKSAQAICEGDLLTDLQQVPNGQGSETDFTGNKMLGSHISLPSPIPAQRARGLQEPDLTFSIYLASTVCPTPAFPCGPKPSKQPIQGGIPPKQLMNCHNRQVASASTGTTQSDSYSREERRQPTKQCTHNSYSCASQLAVQGASPALWCDCSYDSQANCQLCPQTSLQWPLPFLSTSLGANSVQCTHNRQSRSLQLVRLKVKVQISLKSKVPVVHTGDTLECLLLVTRGRGLYYMTLQDLQYTRPPL